MHFNELSKSLDLYFGQMYKLSFADIEVYLLGIHERTSCSRCGPSFFTLLL